MSHPIQAVEDQVAFALAGNATFTIVSKRTGTRFTYKVKQCEDKPTLYFVALMNGSDNENNFVYLGTLLGVGGPTSLAHHDAQAQVRYKHGVKSQISVDAPSAVVFQWWWDHKGDDRVEFWHEDKCGKCGRKLTVPESIERGIGLECWKTVGAGK